MILDMRTQDIKPYWDEEHKGVFVPIINKVLDIKDLCIEVKRWVDAMNLARNAGKELPSREEMLILSYYEDEINEILAQHNGDPLMGCYWSRSEYNDRVARVMIFSNGVMDNLSKVFPCRVRAVSSINMNTINTENNRKRVYLIRNDDIATYGTKATDQSRFLHTK